MEEDESVLKVAGVVKRLSLHQQRLHERLVPEKIVRILQGKFNLSTQLFHYFFNTLSAACDASSHLPIMRRHLALVD